MGIFNSEFFKQEKTKMYFSNMLIKINNAYKQTVVYPSKDKVFSAFELTPLDETKVVIVGQDPYHGEEQAMGLAFSVNNGIKLPASLKNIYKEIENDLGEGMDYNSGDLTYLAKQGVLLLNNYLIVKKGEPLSLNFPEFDLLLENVLKYLNNLQKPLVFVLWGTKAAKLKRVLTNSSHLVITSNHPSPLSANRGGFFNTHQFSTINNYLRDNNQCVINWHNKK